MVNLLAVDSTISFCFITHPCPRDYQSLSVYIKSDVGFYNVKIATVVMRISGARPKDPVGRRRFPLRGQPHVDRPQGSPRAYLRPVRADRVPDGYSSREDRGRYTSRHFVKSVTRPSAGLRSRDPLSFRRARRTKAPRDPSRHSHRWFRHRSASSIQIEPRTFHDCPQKSAIRFDKYNISNNDDNNNIRKVKLNRPSLCRAIITLWIGDT